MSYEHQLLDEEVATMMADILVYGSDNLAAFGTWDADTRRSEYRKLREVLYRYIQENDCGLWAQATGVGGEHE
jgi:hypothetical protein